MIHRASKFFVLLLLLLLTGTSAQSLDWEYIGTTNLIRPLSFTFAPDGTVLLQTRSIENSIFKSAGVWPQHALERLTAHGIWDLVHTVTAERRTCVAALENGTLVAGSYGWIYRSADGGLTWRENEGRLSMFVLNTIETAPDGTLYLGGYGTPGNNRSPDNGLSWQPLDLPYQGRKYIFPGDGVILAAVFTGIWPDPPSYLYRTDDSGDTWSEVLTFPESPKSYHSAVSPAGRVYLALECYNESSAYRSDDAGLTWTPIDAELPNGITGLALYDDTTVFISISNGGIFRTTDSGDHWEHVTEVLPSQTTGTPLITPDGALYVFVGGYGIYWSDDTGETWEITTDEEMTDVIVFECAPDGTLYAAVRGGDVYRAKTVSPSVGEQPGPAQYLTVSPPYPNPFNPSVTLSYHLPRSEYVTVKIFNQQGQVIDTLADEFQPAGNRQITWDAGGQASGMYFYRVEAGIERLTGKMLLMK